MAVGSRVVFVAFAVSALLLATSGPQSPRSAGAEGSSGTTAFECPKNPSPPTPEQVSAHPQCYPGINLQGPEYGRRAMEDKAAGRCPEELPCGQPSSRDGGPVSSTDGIEFGLPRGVRTRTLLLAGTEADAGFYVVDVDHQAVRFVPIRGLPSIPRGDQTGLLLGGPGRIGDELVVGAGARNGAIDVAAGLYALPANLNGRAHPVILTHDQSSSAASIHPGRLWIQLEGSDWGSGEYAADSSLLEEIDLTGRVTRRSSPPPARTRLVAAVPEGLILASRGRHDSRLQLWDPLRGRVARTLSDDAQWSSLSVDGRYLLWMAPGCDPECSMHITDTESGADRTVPLPAGVGALCASPAPSPNRRLVAVALTCWGDHGIILVDVADGTTFRVPGSQNAAGANWSPDGTWIFWDDWRWVSELGGQMTGAYHLDAHFAYLFGRGHPGFIRGTLLAGTVVSDRR